jgi:hypothetical protein
MKADGDEFYIYSETVVNPLIELGNMLGAGSAGYYDGTF